jgi:hypothetical protein
MRSSKRLYVTIAFASVALSPALGLADAEADARKKAARTLIEAGNAAVEDFFFADAVRAWRLALELGATNPELVCHIGNLELRLNRYRDAAESLTRCMVDMRPAKTPADATLQKDHRADLAKARLEVGALRIEIDRPGAEVAVDGRVVGVSPVQGEVFVDPGRHWITAVFDGRAPAAEVVEIAKGTSRVVRLTIGEPLGSAPPAAQPPAAQPPAAPPPAAQPAPLPGAPARSVLSTPPALLPVAPPSLTEKPSVGWIVAGSALSAGAAALGVTFATRAASARDKVNGSLADAGASGASFCGGGAVGAACEAHRGAIEASRTYGVLTGVSFGVAGTLALGTVGYALFPRSAVKPAVTGRGVTVTIEF